MALAGRFCVLEPLESARHYEDLLAAWREAFERWLDVSNFDAAGVQRCSLADLRQQRA